MSKALEQIMDTEIKWVAVDQPEQLHPGDRYVTHKGVWKLADFEFHCYVLSDGERVIDAKDLERFFGMFEQEIPHA